MSRILDRLAQGGLDKFSGTLAGVTVANVTFVKNRPDGQPEATKRPPMLGRSHSLTLNLSAFRSL